jgi:(p)ppGpp synthase/HD superfamily hydrolase
MNRYEALKHAVKAHEAETGRCGALAVLHPIAVAEAVEDTSLVGGGWEDTVVVAFLHEVWEDTDYELPDLADRQRLALELVTRKEGQTYADYITMLCCEQYRDVREIACHVKLADLWHNLQPERQACLPSKERASLERRYLKARDRIWKALGYEWWPEALEGEG